MVIQHPTFPSFPFAFLAQDHKKVNLALSSGRRILQIEQWGQVAGVHMFVCPRAGRDGARVGVAVRMAPRMDVQK